MREAAQMVSYEVPRALCVVIPVLVAGTLNLDLIAQQQQGMFWNWYVFYDPFLFCAFWVFFTCATAGCKRAPFDLAEAESELVAGFHTEYSGLRWSFFFMAEYGSMFAASGVAILLYLGGWHTGLLPFDPATWLSTRVLGSEAAPSTLGWVLGSVFNAIVFIVKGWLLVFVMMWVRWTLPRLRIDQVMMTCVKYLIPISCVMLLFASVMPLITNSLGIGRLPRNLQPGYPALLRGAAPGGHPGSGAATPDAPATTASVTTR
jgi:NADH-quinone oxidoreductase subunit H